MPKIFYRSLLICAVACAPLTAHALDLLEPYNKGFTDIELYYGNQNGNEHNVTPVFAYGFSDYLNPILSTSFDIGSEGSSYSLGISNLATIYQGIIDVDLIPGIWVGPDTSLFNLALELSLPMGLFTPYVQASTAHVANDVSDNSQSVSVGMMVQVTDKQELFMQAMREFSDESASGGAVGFNQQLNDSFELITEIGYLSTWNASLGMIWTFDPLF